MQGSIRIQSLCRQFIVKKRVKRFYVSQPLFEKAQVYLQNPDQLCRLPTALAGRTPVYIPPDISVVIKEAGFVLNHDRFDEMQKARMLCEKNGYIHLVIPKARPIDRYIVEEKLDIHHHAIDKQIALYIAHRVVFTEAVRELTSLLCQADLKDIITMVDDSDATGHQVPIGRYDNLPFILDMEARIGKIGLIDLEGFTLRRTNSKHACFAACRMAVILYPYHVDDILDAAAAFDPEIEKHRDVLEQCSRQVLRKFVDCI